MLSISRYQRNANQNYNEISPHTGQNGIIKKSTNNKCCRGYGEKGTLLTLLVENSVEIPQKPGTELPYNPAISLLGINPKETRNQNDTSTSMFIAALFTIAKTWKQPRCPLADERIRKLQYIYTMKYYSVIKTNALSQF